MMGTRPGLAPYDGRCVAEAVARETGSEPDGLMDELEAWAHAAGGDSEWRQQPRSGGSKLGRIVRRDTGPPTLVLWLPRDL
jgi:hypothetical protein